MSTTTALLQRVEELNRTPRGKALTQEPVRPRIKALVDAGLLKSSRMLCGPLGCRMRIEVTRTRYNLNAIVGWFALLVGLVGCVVQYFFPSPMGFANLVVGVIGGGVTITRAGPLRAIERRHVDLPGTHTKGQA